MKTFIIITGPRHAGKTTLCEWISDEGIASWVCLDGLYNKARHEAGDDFQNRLEELMLNFFFSLGGSVIISDGASYSYPWLWQAFLRAARASTMEDIQIHGIHLKPPEDVRYGHYLEVKDKLGHDPRHNLDTFSKYFLPPPDESFIEMESSAAAINEIRRIIRMSEVAIYQSFDLPYFKHKGISSNPSKAVKLFNGIDFKGRTVADFGCCEGYYCFVSALRGASEVTGYDFDPGRLETAERIKGMAKGEADNVSFVRADLTDPNFIPKKADYTIFCSVSHHLPLLQTIRKIAAATKRISFMEILVDDTLQGPVLKYQKGRQWVEEIIPSIECAREMLETYFKSVTQLSHDSEQTDRVFFICHK